MTCRNQQNGAVIARCSQPMIGVLHWRCQEDEKMLRALSEASVPPVEPTNQVRVKRERKRKKVVRESSSLIKSVSAEELNIGLQCFTKVCVVLSTSSICGAQHTDYMCNHSAAQD